MGTAEVRVDRVPTGTLADYVSGASGAGELRVWARCTRSSTFYTSGEPLAAVYERP